MDTATPLVVDLGDVHDRRDTGDATPPRPGPECAAGTAAARDVLLVVPLRLLVPTTGAGSNGQPLVLFADRCGALRDGCGSPATTNPVDATATTGALARFAGWTIDLGSRRLTAPHAAPRTLPPAEFRLLLAFLAEPRRVIPRTALALRALQDRDVRCARTLDVYVSRLRRHLRAQRRLPGPIGTVRSVGYVLNADVEYVDARH